MKFVVTKTSDWGYEEEVEINTLEEMKDLSTRLPYGVKVNTNRGPELVEGLWPFGFYDIKIEGNFDWSYLDFKSYLRPMSSITKEEKKELTEINCQGNLAEHKYAIFYRSQDWLNAHHFDYRRLIEKGLALEAPEGMYK